MKSFLFNIRPEAPAGVGRSVPAVFWKSSWGLTATLARKRASRRRFGLRKAWGARRPLAAKMSRVRTAAEVARIEGGTRETVGRGAQQERGGRSGCRGGGALGGVIAPVAKATAVLARDVALEPALLPDKGRTQTK